MALLNCNEFNNIWALANLYRELNHVTNVAPNSRGNYNGFWSKDISAISLSNSIIYKFKYIDDNFRRIGPWFFEVKYSGQVICQGKKAF